MKEFIFLLVVISIIVIFVKIFLEKKFPLSEKKVYRYKKREVFMTEAERNFFSILLLTIGEQYQIFAQVHLPTIVDHKINGQNWKGAFRHIDEKSVDFVLCEKVTLKPILAIELDDRSHEEESRMMRDEEVKRIIETDAGIPLLRIKNEKSYSSEELKMKISEKLI